MKRTIIVCFSLLLLFGGGYAIYAKLHADQQRQVKVALENEREVIGSKEKSFAAEEVARHDSPDDCWTIIRGNVYDVTAYIARHPGGDEIERACGKDATTLFETRTTEEGDTIGSGMPHSKVAREQLEKLKVGTVD